MGLRTSLYDLTLQLWGKWLLSEEESTGNFQTP